jgi:hypothetical protein
MVYTVSPALTESTKAMVVETTAHTETLWMDRTPSNPASRDEGTETTTGQVGTGKGVYEHSGTRQQTTCSCFAALFSSCREDHCIKDAQGHILFDHDPELVCTYIHIEHVEDPAAPLDPPTAPDTKCQEWACLHLSPSPFHCWMSPS